MRFSEMVTITMFKDPDIRDNALGHVERKAGGGAFHFPGYTKHELFSEDGIAVKETVGKKLQAPGL